MSNAAMTDSDPSIVEAELNYIVDDGKPSIRYIDWPEEDFCSYFRDLGNILNN